jgi:hypothetical protein
VLNKSDSRLGLPERCYEQQEQNSKRPTNQDMRRRKLAQAQAIHHEHPPKDLRKIVLPISRQSRTPVSGTLCNTAVCKILFKGKRSKQRATATPAFSPHSDFDHPSFYSALKLADALPTRPD